MNQATNQDTTKTTTFTSYADMLKKPTPITLAQSPPKSDDRFVTLSKKTTPSS